MREDALGAVRHAENIMEAMGLLKTRTVGGFLHTDRIVESMKREQEGE